MKCLLIPLFLSLAWTGQAEEKIAILTAYCPCIKCCGDFPGKVRGQTASGKMAKEGRTLAMPKEFRFGTEVYLDGKLLGICEDRGGAIKMKDGKVKIDVYIDSHERALEFGKKEVKIKIKEPK